VRRRSKQGKFCPPQSRAHFLPSHVCWDLDRHPLPLFFFGGRKSCHGQCHRTAQATTGTGLRCSSSSHGARGGPSRTLNAAGNGARWRQACRTQSHDSRFSPPPSSSHRDYINRPDAPRLAVPGDSFSVPFSSKRKISEFLQGGGREDGAGHGGAAGEDGVPDAGGVGASRAVLDGVART
jgi:hypothetical protein